MLSAKKNILQVLIMLLLLSCTTDDRRAYYPNQILGRKIAFFTKDISSPGSQIKGSINSDSLYMFHTNGNYESFSDGDLMEKGVHSYNLKKGSNQSLLVLCSGCDEKTTIRTIKMTFQTPYTGFWENNLQKDSESSSYKKGTFRILN